MSIKYIFPYLKIFIKRSLIIYESELEDDECKKILENISFPVSMIGFPKNNLTQRALENTIEKSSDLQIEIIDFSYNKGMAHTKGAHMLNIINNNPAIKKLYLRGCQVPENELNQFFDALSSNLCLDEIHLDYYDSYNDAMKEFLSDFNAVVD
jgi:hypothetical protein